MKHKTRSTIDLKYLGKSLGVVAAIGFSLLFLLGAGGRESSLEMAETSDLRHDVVASDSSVDDAPPSLVEVQTSFRQVAQSVLPVVVEVNVVDVIEREFQGARTPFEYFFGNPRNDGSGESREFRRSGLGSGVLVARDGNSVYVLTNDHVVGEADEISVTLYDGREFESTLIGTDERRDLALVSFETKEDVPLAMLGNSDSLMPGDWVLAVGNPYGFESTITAGIVSAIGRRANGQYGLAGLTEYIQTDAAINQGNSGGALVNIYGEVVGINSWIASPSGGNIGLGFAIPINVAKNSIDDFIRMGDVQYGWLGVTIGNLSDEARNELKIDASDGSFVYNVVEASPAEKAGLLPGDYVLSVNGRRVQDADDLVYTVGNLPTGTRASMELIRQGRRITTNLEIGARPEDDEVYSVWPGFSAVPMTEEIRSQFRIPADGGNIVVAHVEDDSSADEAGLRAGDIIAEINGRKAATLMDLYGALNAEQRGAIEMSLIREGREISATLVR